ncbi:ABC transporter ATP-binding protein [Gordonia jinhuaensis]|uniref:ABC transporter ATP-binding protein n=1 Tax=Gordonia jinhuaensis TaxID=1517702 RepID=A0A916WQN7_9ACTN|nr:ABC transporter ATP-binding protein [Gordonia jinhuaensis]GGB20669.1 ABC transporter ATP-binding protein [Gordonia jinhuaensis]
MIEFAAAAVEGRLAPTTLRLDDHLTAVIGSNGSGKSTLARLINGLIDPTSGTVTVNGIDTRRHGARVRRQVGFVFTDPAAQLVMPTVIEDISLSLRRQHRAKSARTEAALAALDRFELSHLAQRSVHALSGGQRQMVALASVLATDPQIVVADEPTTLLDLRNARRVGDVLCGLSQQVVIVTHDLDLAARCDRALVVESGSVVYDGQAQEAVGYYRGLVVGDRA